jgi:hypothetical protein
MFTANWPKKKEGYILYLIKIFKYKKKVNSLQAKDSQDKAEDLDQEGEKEEEKGIEQA